MNNRWQSLQLRSNAADCHQWGAEEKRDYIQPNRQRDQPGAETGEARNQSPCQCADKDDQGVCRHGRQPLEATPLKLAVQHRFARTRMKAGSPPLDGGLTANSMAAY